MLHFDDEKDFLDLTREYIEAKTGDEIEIDSHTEPSRIMDILTTKPYDVIVSDFMMPGMDGLKLLTELKKLKKPLPFIMFTGRGREEVVIKCLNLGAEYYIEKSDDPDSYYSELIHAIRSVVKHKRTETRLKESQQRFRFLTDQSLLGIIILQDNIIKYVNEAASEVM
ncbi:MAG: response regulator, partial [Candidatus Hodarchaeales archaeon]